MVKLQYVGDHEREFPGAGVFKPGDEKEYSKETAAVLLETGYFVEKAPIYFVEKAPIKENKKEGDK